MYDNDPTHLVVMVTFLSSAPVEAPAYLIDLMHDKNTEIRKVCDNTLDIIAVSNTHTLTHTLTDVHTHRLGVTNAHG